MHRSWLYALYALASLTSPARGQALEAGGGDGAAPLEHCQTDLRLLNTVTGWQAQWPHQWALAGSSPGKIDDQFVAKWREAPRALARDIAALRAGLASGTAAPRSTVVRVLSQIVALQGEMDHGQFATGEWRSDRGRAIIDAIRPGVEDYRRFLAEDYLPHASNDDGLPRTVEGRRCYNAAVEQWTGIAVGPAATEAIGWRLLHETDVELVRTAGIRPNGEQALLDRLRTPDPNARISGADLIRISERAIRRAEAALPKWFAEVPERPLAVEPMDVLTAQSAPGGVYHPAGEDHAEASFDVNTSRPAERRLMAEVIAFHEGVPGHHLAFIAAKSSGTFNAGFAEGWAIYAEYLADQMGLYSSSEDRIGMMTKHLWAASRLIVEPGLHVHGWTRDQAIRFMLSHTALSHSEIENEVDRYISMPGQSLSYMLGYERFRAARDRARKALGPKFTYPEFHQVLLAKGMRKFNEVDRDVDQWVALERGRGSK